MLLGQIPKSFPQARLVKEVKLNFGNLRSRISTMFHLRYSKSLSLLPSLNQRPGVKTCRKASLVEFELRRAQTDTKNYNPNRERKNKQKKTFKQNFYLS